MHHQGVIHVRIEYLKIISLIVIAFGLLINHGCMRIYFVEGKEEKGKELKMAGQRGLLDESPRIDTQGDVTIEIQFAGATIRGYLAFNVRIVDTPSVKLGQYRLDKMSTLSNDQGTLVRPSMWEISFLSASGRYLSGTVYFPSKDASGRLLLAEGVRKVTLRIEELAGISERIFEWDVSAGSTEKRAGEKILWVDDDLGMHVSFSNFWRAVKNALKPDQKEVR